MTNADYYVNVYRDGVLGMTHTSRQECVISPNEYCPIKVLGVWHIKLKD